MKISRSRDDIIRDWNDQAKTEGRYLGKAFWEVPRSPGSILDRPETPEAEERIRKVEEEIERARRAAAAPITAAVEETQDAVHSALQQHTTPQPK